MIEFTQVFTLSRSGADMWLRLTDVDSVVALVPNATRSDDGFDVDLVVGGQALSFDISGSSTDGQQPMERVLHFKGDERSQLGEFWAKVVLRVDDLSLDSCELTIVVEIDSSGALSQNPDQLLREALEQLGSDFALATVDQDSTALVNSVLSRPTHTALIGVVPPPPPPPPSSPVITPAAGVGPSQVVAPVLASTDAAATVEQWAAKWKLSDDPYVTGLASAVRRRDNMTMWANIDPFDMLPTASLNAGRNMRRIAKTLTLLRNVLVFVPVALTWLAIRAATTAFGAYAERKQGEQVNFLQFWQSGGDGGQDLSSSWRIPHIAMLTALIVMVIVVTTLVAGTLESLARGREDRERTVAERDRTTVALRLAQALAPNRTADPESIAESLAFAINDLSAACRDVGLAAERLEFATASVGSLNPLVEKLNAQIAQLASQVGSEVRDQLESLSTSVSKLGLSLGGDVHNFVTDIVTSLEEVNDRLKQTSTSVEFGTKQLRDDLDAMHGRLGQLVGRR